MDRAGAIEQSIGKRGLPVIDMRDDAKVSGQLDRHKAQHYAGVHRVGQLSAASALLLLIIVLVLVMVLAGFPRLLRAKGAPLIKAWGNAPGFRSA
jgi:hypothetical protein